MPNPLWFIFRMALLAALGGAVYAYFVTSATGGPVFTGIGRGLTSGGIIGAALSALNIYVLQAPLRRGGRRLPFLPHVAVRSLIYLGVLVFGAAIGQLMFPIPGSPRVQVSLSDVIFFYAFSFVVTFLMDLNSLMGQNVLVSFVTGRYFRPHLEQRVFLIIDMRNSTAAAERLGEIDFHRLVNRFVSDLTGPIVERNGEIHKYVGDELIATWPLDRGVKDARCISACFGAIQRMVERKADYEREFGLAVSFRAALHCGPIVIGEMGSIRKEIAMIGDTLNTAARIVEACREFDEPVLASFDLINQLTLPAGASARPLGPIALRGRAAPVELFALSES